MYFGRLLRSALFVLIFGIVAIAGAPSASADLQTLVFTENSATDLRVTLGGTDYGTVLEVKADAWVWTPPTGVYVVNYSELWWAVPGSGGNLINRVTGTGDASTPVLNNLSITSDLQNTGIGFGMPNGTATNWSSGAYWLNTQPYPNQAGAVFYNAQFSDQRGTSPVPIPGTAWLLGPALAGLIGLKRKYRG